MSQNIYQPCVCGSGKKFKFCCLMKSSDLNKLTDKEIIERSCNFPIYKISVNQDWQESGMAQIVVVREITKNKYLLAVYLVDIFCLGLKDTFLRVRMTFDELTNFSENFPFGLKDISYEDARNLILGGIEYAKNFNIEPHEEWEFTSLVVEGNRDFERKFTFGKNGSPLYAQGDNDDVVKILSQLTPFIEKGLLQHHSIDEQLQSTAEISFEDECEEVAEYLEFGNYYRAKYKLQILFQKYPDHPKLLFFMGTCLALEARTDEGISYLEKSAKLEPSAEVYYNLAGLYRKEIFLPEALIALEKVIELNGKHGPLGKQARRHRENIINITKKHTGLTVEEYQNNKTRFNEAFSYLRSGNLEAAIIGFKNVLAVEPSHVQSNGNLGIAYAALGDRTHALKHFDKAIKLDPYYEPAINNRMILLELGAEEKFNIGNMKEIEFYSDKPY